MRVLIISDIHGNLEALQRVLEIAEGVDSIWVLGDTVGYGPNPSECLSIVREKAEVILCGNHDMAAAGTLPYSGFNAQAARADADGDKSRALELRVASAVHQAEAEPARGSRRLKELSDQLAAGTN